MQWLDGNHWKRASLGWGPSGAAAAAAARARTRTQQTHEPLSSMGGEQILHQGYLIKEPFGKKPGLFVDVFSGTGCVSRAAGKQRYKVITVDWEGRPGDYERQPRPKVDGDVHDSAVQKKLFALKPNVAWASIPCENVSRAKTTGKKRTLNQTKKNTALVKKLAWLLAPLISLTVILPVSL